MTEFRARRLQHEFHPLLSNTAKAPHRVNRESGDIMRSAPAQFVLNAHPAAVDQTDKPKNIKGRSEERP